MTPKNEIEAELRFATRHSPSVNTGPGRFSEYLPRDGGSADVKWQLQVRPPKHPQQNSALMHLHS